jgi:superfamily II DNA helicase RecQ
MGIVITCTTNAQGMSIAYCYSIVYMVPTPHNVLDLVQEISRAGRDGKDSVTMVQYNSYNLRTGEPEVKAVVTSTGCRRLAMLNVFLRESNKTHKFVTYVQANVVVAIVLPYG